MFPINRERRAEGIEDRGHIVPRALLLWKILQIVSGKYNSFKKEILFVLDLYFGVKTKL